MNTLFRTAAAVLVLNAIGFSATPAKAQQAGLDASGRVAPVAGPVTDFAAVRATKVYHTTKTAAELVIDGALDELAWSGAPSGSGFYQTDPQNGFPATEDTQFRILYDDDNIYVGVTAFQTDPILISELKRDFAAMDGDMIVLFFDTFHDQRNGFAFTTNPGSAMLDQQIAEGVVNANWDGIFEVASKIHDWGWTAEFRVPFKTLRFDDKQDAQTWGFNIQRIMRHKNEWVQWSPAPRPFRIFEASIAGTLEGVAGVRQGMNLNVKPFVVGNAQPGVTLEVAGRKDFDGGLDVKYGVTSRLTLDLTVRTDFSQVEADEQQVNLTRFSLFVPEQRVFFLENLGLFDVCGNAAGGGGGGGGGGRCGAERDIIPFFSRQIGLSPDGQPLPIRAGARLTGKVAGLDVGLLDMNVESSQDGFHDNWTVARLRRDIFSNSQIGVMAFDRRSGATDDWNRAVSADGNLNFLQRRLNLSGFVTRAEAPGKEDDNLATSVQLNYQERWLAITSGFVSISDNFENDFSFVPRVGIRKYLNSVGFTPRFRNSFILEANPRVIMRYTTDASNRLLTRFNAVGIPTTFSDGANLTIFRNMMFERLDKPFLIQGRVTIPAGDYEFADWNFRYSSSRARRVSGNVGLRTGEFYSGTKRELSAGGSVRYSKNLQASVTWGRNFVDLVEGEFTTDLVGARVDASFSPRMFLQSFVQYNTAARTLSTNIRYRFIHHPLSDFFIVYNESRGIDGNTAKYRVVSVKLTHNLNF